MVLREYLTRHDISDNAFAKAVGVSRATVGKWCRPADAGGQIPGYKLMRQIRRHTFGKVCANDFYHNE